MRTTLAIDDDILRMLKRRALDEGRTVQDVTNDLLRAALSARPSRSYKLELAGWKAELRPGVDLTDRDKLLDLMGGRG